MRKVGCDYFLWDNAYTGSPTASRMRNAMLSEMADCLLIEFLYRLRPCLLLQDKFLNALTACNLAGIEVALRIHGDGMHFMELSGHAAAAPKA